ncbi:hypothetical protein HanHA300_Chr14g0539801 [Helianthus annuus]|nr:hypothetical protein HanHA300_Chr14g0539801 [Helianthus annuus]KAJ0487171.1 hypothetical protein HanHA89_Chr14g0587571 [Helianthus annuus]KAJ0719852.1 hypothetical protein HanLR1_Chr08g0286401 [Helianthus annuus]KAJ0723079.1 hypothetical protein HanOQP8_Chr08g0293911 [Helianthus annuus]
MNSGDIPVNQSFRPRRWGERQWFSARRAHPTLAEETNWNWPNNRKQII